MQVNAPINLSDSNLSGNFRTCMLNTFIGRVVIMLVLFETAAEFALFNIKNRAKFESIQVAVKELENQDFLNLK